MSGHFIRSVPAIDRGNFDGPLYPIGVIAIKLLTDCPRMRENRSSSCTVSVKPWPRCHVLAWTCVLTYTLGSPFFALLVWRHTSSAENVTSKIQQIQLSTYTSVSPTEMQKR